MSEPRFAFLTDHAVIAVSGRDARKFLHAQLTQDIEALAGDCRFADCRHRDEPRCAVKLAVAEGRVPAERLASYVKLQEELASLDARKDARAMIDEKRRARVMGKAIKQFQKQRGR